MENQEVFEELSVAPQTPVQETVREEPKQAVKPAHPLSGVALALSIISCWFAPSMGVIAIGSLIMSIIAMVDSKKKDYGAKGMNVASLVVSIFAIVLFIAYWILVAFMAVLYIALILMIMETNTEYAEPIYAMMMR